MFIAFFVLWVVLNGRWTTEIAMFGAVFAALLTAFCYKFMGVSFKKELDIWRGFGSGARYLVTLLREIINANCTVIRMILDLSFEPEPQLVHFHSGLKREHHRVMLADSITLTPGTITCELEGDEFYVHCLDKSLMDGLDSGELPRQLREMEARAEQREAQRAQRANKRADNQKKGARK